MRPLLLITALASAVILAAQPISSVADGDWNDTSTWDCGCIPTGFVSVTIVHAVTVTVPDSLAEGDLYVQPAGQLNGSSLLVGGIFYNFGQVDLDALELRSAALPLDAYNAGVLSAGRFGTQREGFVNAGVLNVDTLRSDAPWENTVTGSVTAAHVSGPGQLWNRGGVTGFGSFAAAFRNDSLITWIGPFTTPHTSLNNGNVVVVGDLRVESFLLDSGLLFVEGDVRVDGDLWLADDTAFLSIAGNLVVAGQLRGAGAVCVTDTTINLGMITDSVDVCDRTPTVALPPFLDVDQGIVGPAVRWCTDPRCQPVGLWEPMERATCRAWPSLTTGPLRVAPVPPGVVAVDLVDAAGRTQRIQGAVHGDGLELDLSGLAAGPYALRVPGMPAIRTLRVVLAR